MSLQLDLKGWVRGCWAEEVEVILHPKAYVQSLRDLNNKLCLE